MILGVKNSAMGTAVRSFAAPCKRMGTGKEVREGGREGWGSVFRILVGLDLERGLDVKRGM